MAKLPPSSWPTIDAVYAWHEDRADERDWRREHLGASMIGRSCSRHLWYAFRWVMPIRLPGRVLRLLERGDNEEDRVVAELKAIGVEVHEKNEAGAQWGCEWWGGHLAGRADGVGLGFLEAPKTWHLIEIKTANAKRWRETVKHGVQHARPDHFAQVQVYMLGLKLRRCFYISVCKDDDAIYAERIRFQPEFAKAQVAKAERVIFSSRPLEKISTTPEWYECRFCDHCKVCHGDATGQLDRNCRTCTESTPRPDGTWWCELYQKTLDSEAQRAGCESHLFLPDLMPDSWKVVDVDAENRSVRYQTPTGIRTDQGRLLT